MGPLKLHSTQTLQKLDTLMLPRQLQYVFEAIRRDNAEFLYALIEYGKIRKERFNFNVRDPATGRTMLSLAIYLRRHRVVKLLRRYLGGSRWDVIRLYLLRKSIGFYWYHLVHAPKYLNFDYERLDAFGEANE